MAPARIFMSDDFPEPLTPMSPTRSPSSMTSSRSRKTVLLPKERESEAARRSVIRARNLDRNVAPGPCRDRRGLLAACHDEHEAAVGDVAAVQLHGLWIPQEPRDLGLRIGALVDDGVAYPAPAIVGTQHLRLLAPVGRILAGGGPPVARPGVREDGADLAVGALSDGRLVPEEEERLCGQGVAQAAAERLAALGGHLLRGGFPGGRAAPPGPPPGPPRERLGPGAPRHAPEWYPGRGPRPRALGLP